MAELKQLFGALTAFTVTNLESLASAAFWQSNSIDNETDLFVDVLVSLTLKNHATLAPTGEKACHVYAYAALDDAEAFTDGTTGTEGTFTIGNRAHLHYLGTALFSAAAQAAEIGPFSVAEAFGGRMPPEWGTVVENVTGFALTTGNLVKWRGLKYQSV